MQGNVIVVHDVLIVRQLELGWLCEIEGRPAFLGKLQVAPGTSLPGEGRRGTIMITVTAAADLGLQRRRTA
jgi:hypothetical protein